MAGNLSRSNDLGIGTGRLLRIITVLSVVFLISPLVILIVFSFNSGRTVTEWEGFSLRWYGDIFHDATLWASVRNSFIIATASTVLSTILGTMAALAVGKYAFKGRELFQNILYIPVILPEIIFGIALLALFLLVKMPLGFISIIIAHTTFSLSFVTLIVLAKLANFDSRLEEASLDMGASRWQTFRYVVFPNLAPAIVSGALFAFTLSIDDFIVTFFTSGVTSSTLPMKMYSLIKFGVSPALNAVSTVLLLFTATALGLANMKPGKSKTGRIIRNVMMSVVGVLLLFFLSSVFFSHARKTLNIYNYADYLSPEVISDFEKEYDVKVSVSYFNDNEELLSRMQMGVSGYDLIFPTSYMVDVMKRERLIQQIDTAKLTNLGLIDKRFRYLNYDTTGAWYIPYAYGFSAIVYNSDIIKDTIDSWKSMWNPKYSPNMLMLDDMMEVFFASYKYLGYDFDHDTTRLREVANAALKQKPLLLKYESNLTREYMLSGDVWIAQSWNGMITRLINSGKQFRMAVPKEGVLFFTDNICIPSGAPHKETAELFIDFLMRPENTARTIETILYAMPNSKARELLPDSLRYDYTMFPSDEVIENMNILTDQGEFNVNLENAWTKVKIK